MEQAKLKDLIGKTMVSVENFDNLELVFTTTDGEEFTLYHSISCSESVTIDDIVGDLSDLVGEPILLAEEATSYENPEGITKGYQKSFTWTFYKFATRKGYVDIRWYGESNGYYSESVDFKRKNQTGGKHDAPTELEPRPDGNPPNISMPWWCPKCTKWVHPYDVTYFKTHDERSGGCGYKCT